MDLISKATRQAFREALVGWTLSQISEMFDAADIEHGTLPPGSTIGGQRRSLVEEYYATVDWTAARDVRKVISIYERVLDAIEPDSDAFRKLTNLLRRDGYMYENGQIHAPLPVDLKGISEASEIVDKVTLQVHLRRLAGSVETDPALAIGSAKELVETVAKLVLHHYGQVTEPFESVQQLVKAALKCLDLTAEDIAESKKGAQSIKQVLSGLSQIVGATAELRNLYGTGHGRLEQERGIGPRHAKLVVGATATLATFLLETLDARVSTEKASAKSAV